MRSRISFSLIVGSYARPVLTSFKRIRDGTLAPNRILETAITPDVALGLSRRREASLCGHTVQGEERALRIQQLCDARASRHLYGAA